YHRSRTRWSASRLAMTHDLVERIGGPRTRLTPETPQRRHQHEDSSLEDYLIQSTALDRWVPPLLGRLPRGWMAPAPVVLLPPFLTGASADRLAVSLGGILLGSLALRRFADGLSELSGAAISWQQARPLFEAAARRPAAPAIADEARSRRWSAESVLEV